MKRSRKAKPQVKNKQIYFATTNLKDLAHFCKLRNMSMSGFIDKLVDMALSGEIDWDGIQAKKIAGE